MGSRSSVLVPAGVRLGGGLQLPRLADSIGAGAQPDRLQHVVPSLSGRRGGGFRAGVGRVGTLPVGGEETELSIRLRLLRPDIRIVYVPAARVRHRVPAARGAWAYFRSRCYQEGRSKALISSIAGRTPVLGTERSYVSRTLPSGVLAGLRDGLRGDASGVARAFAIVAGLAMTTAGYGAARIGLDRIVDGAPAPDGGS